MANVLGYGAQFNSNERALGISKEEFAEVYEKAVLLSADILANQLGIYSYRKVGKNNVFAHLGMDIPRFPFQGRIGNKWLPKGHIDQIRSEAELVDVELNMSQFPDGFFHGAAENFFEYALEPNAEYDISVLIEPILSVVMKAKRDGLTDLSMFLNHPDIPAIATETYNDDLKATANATVVAAQPADMSLEKWLAFHDQMRVKYDATNFGRTGWVSKLDLLANGTNPNGYATHFKQIADADYSNGQMVGSALDLFDDMIRTSPIALRELVYATNPQDRPVIMASREVFDKFISELQNLGTDIEYLDFIVDGERSATNYQVANYKGVAVMACPEFEKFDLHTGVKRLRAVLTARGNISILSKVEPINNPVLQGEQGLVVQQSPLLRDKGRIDMMSYTSVGAGICDYDLVVYARSNANL